ncbi:bifunctional diaminohydroxyphosphoribosylaminopyrimidine deaminase/5-amino-6-(5-phosphoribosylamino)uracil reductase RibD [Pontibacter sp. G13]|uniref:bifunctional diaminohydroxyphosphoribosylaminopyrimidine deaminase/5-amino-6-(5-phosphoribosylamino)uracil reductase RibD n=1 Tax=Pontibacter sp. G13 TaxID=3074898 RepID=UPI002889802C|nr:bifunctional diaminohydroxyphosphoribosylaminopyrimidine deaminase/5-amino-6-(5-phosphoribosylamino)uracil reductase RibD [Pontibacter sp. G13]WNJ20248.1 bifunctional diaminohydroxyphosphoribosylaminopyrimidine deaminase/5-amino-6-(5-phosphoribosylamino)uracil reductase RibD [Pontibacter sp. G13]
MNPEDHRYLQRCITLARMGTSAVFPNPQVGAVIVHNGQIIGEGYHQRHGEPHAEVFAIRSVVDHSLLPESTMYVSLEPCSHYGKTPPCSELICKHKLKRVVVGCLDPNPKVSGRGIKMMREGGVQVELADDPAPFQQVNRAFITNQVHRRPYITLKWAETQDGFIAQVDDMGQPRQAAITGRESREFVHQLRASHHAILVGTETALVDDPRLDNRHFPGQSPTRILLDRNGRLPKSLKAFTDGNPTILLTERTERHFPTNVQLATPPNWEDWMSTWTYLYQSFSLSSILIEGGAQILQQILRQGAYDQTYQLVAEKGFGAGIAAPTLPTDLAMQPIGQLGPDTCFHGELRPLSQLLHPESPSE